uniref:Uncharacterized protein n=1 Tax=Anopheles maculatus TaxID=74869 RepID=A0A182SSW7_9DIPT
MHDHFTNQRHKFSSHPTIKTSRYTMRSYITVLCVAVAVLAISTPSHAGRIPEAIDNRLAELNKWFEARIPIYEKANYLLKRLGTEVAKLSDMHNGIDFYYQGYSDLQYYGIGGEDRAATPHSLRIVKVVGDGVDLKPVEEVVRKALEKRNVKNILHLAPEIKDAFKSIMEKKA